MGLSLFNTSRSRVIPPALLLSSLLLLTPSSHGFSIPRNASPTHSIPSSSPPTLAAVSPTPRLEDAVLLRIRRLCSAPAPLVEGAGRVSSPPGSPEQQQGVDLESSEGKCGLGLLARARAMLPEVEIAVPLLGPILAVMPLADLTSRPLQFLRSFLVATLAGVLWRMLCEKVIPQASTQARRTLLQLRREAHRLELEEGSLLPAFSANLKAILFGLGVDALSSLVSGSLVCGLVFWVCMPTTGSRMRLSIQISGVMHLMVLLGAFCLVVVEILAIATISVKIELFLKRRHHQQPARCHWLHESTVLEMQRNWQKPLQP